MNNSSSSPMDLATYLKTKDSHWYWVTLAQASITVAIVLLISENSFPFVYLRYVLSGIFVLFIPGYSLIRALFPINTHSAIPDHLGFIERMALVFVSSLGLDAIIGFILNYTFWGVRLIPITLSLFYLTIILATVALLREFQYRSKPLNM